MRFLGGFVLSFSLLWLLGIIRARWLPRKVWIILWTLYSLALAALIIISVLENRWGLDAWAMGAALGYVVAVGWHTLHHALEEITER